ncbi:MAG: cation-translocating P-type ATPase [Candidatus Portnoybacteria bacterium]|nr:cation-translocating P-type ATPase [Candidatus Portnoybacteria bacterium]
MHKKKHRHSTFWLSGEPIWFWFDFTFIFAALLVLAGDFFSFDFRAIDHTFLVAISVIGFLPVVWSAIKGLFHGRLSIDLLAAIALIFALLAREWRSAVFIGLMLASARLFAKYTETQAKSSIKSLLKLRPAKVHILVNGKPVEARADEIKIGDLVLVEAGDRIAVDGFVESGQASIDQSSLTGESMPVSKQKGDQVLSSTLNLSGSLVIKAEKVGKETTFSKILELVEKSQEEKTPVISITEKLTKWYILATLLGIVLIYLFFNQNLSLLLSILLVTCADDIAVAIPLAFTAAIGTAAKWGIIIKGGQYLEQLYKVKIAVFDKTGTLTQGRMQVQSFLPLRSFPAEKFEAIAGAVEYKSNHPSAKAICRYLDGKKDSLTTQEMDEKPGYGILAKVNGWEILAGKIIFLEKNGVVFSEEEKQILMAEKDQNRTVTVFALDKAPIGFASISDEIRPNTKRVLDSLKNLGVKKLIMLTGDNEKVAGSVAAQLGLDEFRANLMPKDKIEFLKDLSAKARHPVLMVGDGVNDAPALARADIGAAMGAIGSDAAVENAEIILMKDNLSNILDAMKLSRYTMKIVRQNIFLWASVNLLGLFLVFLNVIGPSGAAAYNFLTDFLPLFNSLKLFRLHQKSSF